MRNDAVSMLLGNSIEREKHKINRHKSLSLAQKQCALFTEASTRACDAIPCGFEELVEGITQRNHRIITGDPEHKEANPHLEDRGSCLQWLLFQIVSAGKSHLLPISSESGIFLFSNPLTAIWESLRFANNRFCTKGSKYLQEIPCTYPRSNVTV